MKTLLPCMNCKKLILALLALYKKASFNFKETTRKVRYVSLEAELNTRGSFYKVDFFRCEQNTMHSMFKKKA